MIDVGMNNAIVRRKKEGSSDCTMRPRSFCLEMGKPLIEAMIGERTFRQTPARCIGIEPRSQEGKVPEMQAAVQPLQGFYLAGGGVIPLVGHRAAQMAQPPARKRADLLLHDIYKA